MQVKDGAECLCVVGHSLHKRQQKMSFLGGRGGAAGGAPQGSVNPNTIDVAVAELDMITDVFNKLVS